LGGFDKKDRPIGGDGERRESSRNINNLIGGAIREGIGGCRCGPLKRETSRERRGKYLRGGRMGSGRVFLWKAKDHPKRPDHIPKENGSSKTGHGRRSSLLEKPNSSKKRGQRKRQAIRELYREKHKRPIKQGSRKNRRKRGTIEGIRKVAVRSKDAYSHGAKKKKGGNK